MNLFGMMETSGGAMRAERMRAEVVAANMANAETTRTVDGTPYHRQHVVFASGQGDPAFLSSMISAAGSTGNTTAAATTAASSLLIGPGTASMSNTIANAATGAIGSTAIAPGVQITQVVEDPGKPLKRYDPGHPDADADGYVSYPDINPVTEMVDLMGATRAYGLNSSAVQAEKGMITSSLEIAKS